MNILNEVEYHNGDDGKLKSFMNKLHGSHNNPVLCSILFPSLSEYDNHREQNYLITGSGNNKLGGEFIVWDLKSGQKKLIFYGHRKPISALAAICMRGDYRSDKLRDFLISGSEDGSIIIWEMKDDMHFVQDDSHLRSPHRNTVTSIAAYAPPSFYTDDWSDMIGSTLSSYLFVSVSLDLKAMVWNFGKIMRGTGDYKEKLGYINDQLKNIAKGDIKHNLIDISKGKHIIETALNQKLFEIKTSKENIKNETALRMPSSELSQIRISPMENNAPDKTIYRHTGGLLSVAIYIPRYRCVKFCETNDCTCKPLIVTSSSDTTIIIWDLETLEGIKVLNGHTKGVNTITIFDPDPLRASVIEKEYYKRGSSPILVSGSIDNTIIVWDLFEGVMIRRLPLEKARTGFEKKSESSGRESGHTASILAVTVFDSSPDQNSPKIVSGGEDKDLIIWDLLSGHKIRTISGGHNSAITSVIVRVPEYDKNLDFLLISCSKDNGGANVNIWNFSTSQTISRSCDKVTFLTVYDPNDNVNNPISFVAHIGGTISVWDIIKLKEIHTFDDQIDKTEVNCVVVYPVPSDELVLNKEENTYELFLASCDCQRVIILRKICICLGKIEETKITSFQVSNLVFTISFMSIPRSSGGSNMYLAIGDGSTPNSVIKLWDLNYLFTLSYDLKKPVREETMNSNVAISLTGHTDIVRCMISYKQVTSTKTKVFLVTGSNDRNVILWSLDLEEPSENIKITQIHIFKGHRDVIFSIAVYSPPQTTISHKNINYLLIFTGSLDNTIRIWDSQTGLLVNELTEHKGGVTSISIYHSEDSPTPLLISAGLDKLIIIWTIDVTDISKINVLRKLIGHTDRVCSLDLYTPKKDSKHSAMIVSGSDDHTLMDFILQMMPTQASALIYFNLDLHNTQEKWPLMKEMTKQYGISFWIENTGLYYLALVSDKSRVDFFETFLPIIKQTIRYTNKVSVIVNKNKEQYSLLRSAIELEDLYVMQLILDCWLENLNKDIEDPLTQRLYHASYFFEPGDIFRLSKKNPKLFINFISNLKLVESSEILNKSYPKTTVFGASRTFVSSCRVSCQTDMWGKIIDKWGLTRGKGNFHVTSHQFFPLVNVASRETFKAYVEISVRLNNMDIFNADVGRIMSIFLWGRHARQSHITQFIVYLLYVALYSYSVYRFQPLIHDHGRSGKIGAFAMEAALLLMTFYYLIEELYQIYREYMDDKRFNEQYGITNTETVFFLLIHKSFWLKFYDHFLLTDIWNINDIAIIGLVFAGTFLRVFENKDIFITSMTTSYQPSFTSFYLNTTNYPTSQPTMRNTVGHSDSTNVKCVYAVATICVYFKILYFLRPFRATGPLVSMILQIAKDISVFLFILFTMMCSFAQVFWILNENSGVDPFGTSIWQSYLYSFMYMMGQGIDPAVFNNSASYPLNVLILNLFMLFMILLMLNLLIALMNDSFGQVREKGLAQWRLEQAQIILHDFWMADIKENPFIYVLTGTSDVDEFFSENESLDNKDNVDEKQQLSTLDYKVDENADTLSLVNNSVSNIINYVKELKNDNDKLFEKYEKNDNEMKESIAQLNSKVDEIILNKEQKSISN